MVRQPSSADWNFLIFIDQLPEVLTPISSPVRNLLRYKTTTKNLIKLSIKILCEDVEPTDIEKKVACEAEALRRLNVQCTLPK